MHKRNIRNVLYLLPLPVSQVVRNFVVVFLMAHYARVEDVGVWGQVLAIHAFAYMFINLNMSFSMARFFPSRSDDVAYTSSSFWAINNLVLGLALVAGALSVLAKSKFVDLFFSGGAPASTAYYLAFFIFLENAFNNIVSYFRAVQKFGIQSILSIVRVTLEIIFVAGGIVYFGELHRLDVSRVFLLNFTALTLSIAIAYAIAFRIGALRLSKPDYGCIKEFARFGIPQLPSNLCSWAVTIMDRMLIGTFLGMNAAGVYFSVSRIGMALQMPFGPLSTVYFTEAAKAYDQKRDLSRTNMKFAAGMAAFLAVCVVVLYASFHIYHARLFAKIGSAEMILPLVCGAMYASFSLTLFNVAMMFWGVEKKSMRVGAYWAACAVLIVTANFLLIRTWGMIVPFLTAGSIFGLGAMVAYIHSRFDAKRGARAA